MSQIFESLRMRVQNENETSHNKIESRDWDDSWDWDESFPWESQFWDRDESLAEVLYAFLGTIQSQFYPRGLREDDQSQWGQRSCLQITYYFKISAWKPKRHLSFLWKILIFIGLLCAPFFSACFYFLRKKQEVWHHRIIHPRSTIQLLIVTLSWDWKDTTFWIFKMIKYQNFKNAN